MRCPYCVEEINDVAVVCRHCGRDFQLLKPLLDKISRLEADLQALREQLATIGSIDNLTRKRLPKPLAKGSSWIHAFAVTLSVAGSTGLYWLFSSVGMRSNILLLGSIAFPSVGGLIVGVNLTALRVIHTFSIGALIGFLDLVGIMLIYHGMPWPLPRDFISAVGVIFLGQALIFSFSKYLGDFLGKRIKRTPLSEGGSPRIAIALARLRHKAGDSKARDIEFWQKVLASLAPVLSLIGTLVSAYFAYLAALTKK